MGRLQAGEEKKKKRRREEENSWRGVKGDGEIREKGGISSLNVCPQTTMVSSNVLWIL